MVNSYHDPEHPVGEADYLQSAFIDIRDRHCWDTLRECHAAFGKERWSQMSREFQELFELIFGLKWERFPIENANDYILKEAQAELPHEEYQLFKLWIDGYQQQQIADQLKKSIGYINTRLRRIREGQMGFWFEDFVKGEGHRAGHGEPDLIAEDGVPVNLKCVGDKRTSKIKRGKLQPEIEYAKTHNTKVRIRVYNIIHNKEQVLEYASLEIPIEIQVNW